MATYSVMVRINEAEVRALIDGGYSLCIAKKVNGQFNVVWKAVRFLMNNRIQWTEQFQVFGAVSFTGGHPVEPGTNASAIQYGQTCTLNPMGVMGTAEGTHEGTTFNVKNEYGTTSLAVNGFFNGEWLPIYVNPTPAPVGVGTFSPVTSILVWFDNKRQTSDMFSDLISACIEVDYAGVSTSKTLSYVSGGSGPGNGMWVTDDPTTGLRFTPAKVYHPLSKNFEDLPFANDIPFIQTLVNKYFATPWGKKSAIYVVQASLTFAEDVTPDQVTQFINDNLPRSVQASIAYEASTLVVKIGWAPAVTSKLLIRGENEVERLKGLFSNMIRMHSEEYRTLDYTTLASSGRSGSGFCSTASLMSGVIG